MIFSSLLLLAGIGFHVLAARSGGAAPVLLWSNRAATTATFLLLCVLFWWRAGLHACGRFEGLVASWTAESELPVIVVGTVMYVLRESTV